MKVKEKTIVKEDGKTFEVEVEETSRKRIYPEDEVRYILARALKITHENMIKNPYMYTGRLALDPFDEVARWALEQIKHKYDLTINEKII